MAASANNPGPSPASHGVADARAAASAAAGAQKHGRSRTTIPTQSGKWILGKTIGAGSMGKVKLAKKEDSNEQVACKIIPRLSPDDGQHSRAERERADQSKEIRTAREAAIVTLLNHPHICGLRDVVRTNYHWYMLFEYVNGGQMLDYIISHGKLKEKQARKFSRQIASALDYCHRNSIVHRDLKIENILISKTGDIKIIDFGLSNLFAPKGHLKTFCGSLYFAAPELLQARAYTGPEVDVWSFGIVLYVLVCGKVPFDDQSMPALHAKIKKGVVDYPSWLSGECKHLLSRMLVTDPKQRATMAEVMTHPWMTKGYPGPPENFLPHREPLQLPLDPEVISAMTGFNFGPPEAIRTQLTRTIESEEYQRAVRLLQKEKDLPQPPKDADKRRGVFDFYKRRNSGNSRDTLTAPSSEGLAMGVDPLNAFSPLISIYYLVKEKQDRERVEPLGGAVATPAPKKEENPAEIAPPPTAYTNSSTYEMPGEKSGGRSRPRARTHGEDDVPEQVKNNALLSPSSAAHQQDGHADQLPKKEGTAAGFLRRLSTRRRKEPERLDKDRSHPPVVHVPATPNETPSLRKSFSIRRTRRDDNSNPRLRSGSSQPQHSDLLAPPLSAGANPSSFRKQLGRSASVNSTEFHRRRGDFGKEPPPTSGSDQSGPVVEKSNSLQPGTQSARSVSMRAKSLGHARRESIQARRARREAESRGEHNPVPEETDAELGEHSGTSNDKLEREDPDLAKPVFLKGLFSVSTTSTKPVPEIRADIKRVLKQLNVDYTEIRGGFKCRHAPSIDLKKDGRPGSPSLAPQTPTHKRRFSFAGRRSNQDDGGSGKENDRMPTTPRTPGTGKTRDRDPDDYSHSDLSDDSITRGDTHGGSAKRVQPGETRTNVRDDVDGNMVLSFEIFVVKVPVISLHGIQFKRLGGNTWQYKNMADQILKELRL
ncbi:Non-specific serine/threonine protein kinase [Coniochaeta hoffmannii]|uniref:non-specific serine/threonine protein kinase n=1 Tax=Coniochaeta hoffmannii TaxID=91930 RepID=A0AA38S677_9PEZI|nr:Non-specific serine/threonine protein kinase [Coniochaeta hoffmannii]